MRLLTIAVVLVLALAGASCGGDDEETAGDTDTVTLETTTEDETTEDTETDTDETVGDSLASEDCQDLINASASLSQAFSSGGSSDLDDVSTFFDEFADVAPEEIRADFQILANAYEAYAEALGDVDLQSGETPDPETLAQLQTALASIDQEEVTAASTRISEWTTENC